MFKSKKKPLRGRTEPAGHPDSGQAPHSVGQPGGSSYGINSKLSYYYQFYLLGTGRFHKKAEPVIMSPKPKGSLLESNGVGHY